MLSPRRNCVSCSIRGVTLLELLSSIGIIIALAALIIPAAGIARDRANQARSTGNLRTIGQAYAMYMADNSMRPPEPLSYYINNQENRTLWEWDGWRGIGFGKLQYQGYLGAPSGVAIMGDNRSTVFFNPDRSRRKSTSTYRNWSDYTYLLTGRYSPDVWTRSSSAIAADVEGGVSVSSAQLKKPKNASGALVLYTDGSTGIVPYKVYSQAKYEYTAKGFDRDAEVP